MKKFSYFVLLQQQTTSFKSDENPLESYKNSIPEIISKTAAEFRRTKSEVIQKNGTILRGGLAHFLSTPLKSDKDDIIRLIEDTIENTVLQLNAAAMLSTVEHTLWKVLDPQDVPLQRQMVGVMKRLLKNGRTMLVDAGCSFSRNSGDIAVSLFQFDGFSTVQSLKSVIDSFTTLDPLTCVNGSFETMLISIEPSVIPEPNLVVINFDFQDDSIIELLNQRIPSLLDQFGIGQLYFSKHALHTSVGSSYQLRIAMNVGKIPLGSMIISLIGDHDELEDAITNHGSLVVLEQWM